MPEICLMKDVYLFRDVASAHCVQGRLFVDGKEMATIERPWRYNKRNESCIPSGVYLCEYMARSASGKYKDVWHVRNVKNRSGILIHNGNLASHSKGCIILGLKRGKLAGLPAVLSSRLAKNKLNRLLGKQSFNLHIIGSQNA